MAFTQKMSPFCKRSLQTNSSSRFSELRSTYWFINTVLGQLTSGFFPFLLLYLFRVGFSPSGLSPTQRQHQADKYFFLPFPLHGTTFPVCLLLSHLCQEEHPMVRQDSRGVVTFTVVVTRLKGKVKINVCCEAVANASASHHELCYPRVLNFNTVVLNFSCTLESSGKL